MAHTNQTPNYGLSEFVGSDKPAWLVDYNGDMEKIDLGMKAAKDVADAAKTEADQGAIDIAAVTITANSADAKASGAISDISDVYDATSTYSVGDLVIYSNILYKCITNITVPEAFDGTHWTRTTVEEITDGLRSDISTVQTQLDAIPKILAGSHAGTTSLISVTFSEPFTTTPSVVATASGSDAIVNNKNVVIRSITTTGFEAKVTKADDGTDTSVGINWVAVGF